MCHACPGCALLNLTHDQSSELVNGFPIKALFLVIHFDAYSAGKHSDFEGSKVYLIGCCGMCRFACMEPVTNPSATTFVSAIMKIHLRYSFCHTSILDKNSNCFGVCHKASDLLQISPCMLSSGNHNPMLVKWVNRYINKGLKIKANVRDSIQVALEAILLLIYAWNSWPVPGTDISRSIVAVGCEFVFSIYYWSRKHWEIVTILSTVMIYSMDLAMHLTVCRAIADLLVKEHCAYHREFINANHLNHWVYAIGNIVFTRQVVWLDAHKQWADKLQYAFTSPWRVTSVMSGTS